LISQFLTFVRVHASEKKLKNNNIHRFFKKFLRHFTLLMGNGAIGNRAKAKEFFKNG
jgi:hypothetical protein